MTEQLELQALADELGIAVVGPLAGGEFGAMLAIDSAGRHLVLKTMRPPTVLTAKNLTAIFERGARMAGRVRAAGYPAPEYIGTGGTGSFAWSLQERLAGQVPDVVTPAHAERLVELAKMHRDAAQESGDPHSFALDRMREHMATVVQDERAVPLSRELRDIVERGERVKLRRNDVVHSDFHHRNYLAIGDDVTGVFDWEFAMPGDWRMDLVNLAFWAAILRNQIPAEAGGIVIDAMFEVCPPDVLRFLAAYQSLRQLDYDVRAHPERVDRIVQALETSIAPWWRGG